MDVQQFTPKLFSLLRKGISLSDIRSEMLAGLTVAIVALPLAMALAIASGASPDKGLITSVIAGFMISFLGGSRILVGGPTGAFVVVVFNVIALHGYDGLILATLLAGIILIAAGYARFGQVIKFMPIPVVTGFTAGIAVIIASSQVRDFLGLAMEDVPADFIPKWVAYLQSLTTLSLSTLLVGAGALFIIFLIRHKAPKLPAYLIAVIAGALAVAFGGLDVDTVGSRFPDMPTDFPLPALPVFSFEKLQQVLPSAFTIAFLAGIEALLAAVVSDGMTGYKHRPNQELVGQGVANIASGLFGGLPATGAIARTAANIKAGGRTPLSGIFHAAFILLFMMFGTDLIQYIPMAALAAILFTVAWGMSEIDHFIHIYRLSASDRTVLLLTFALTVLVDITVAISVGVGLAALLFIKHMSNAVEISGRQAKGLHDGDELEDQRASLPAGVEVYRITGPVFFGVAGDLVDTLKRRMGKMPKVLIIRMRLVPFLDATGAKALEILVEQCKMSGTSVIFSAVQRQPQEMLARAHLAQDGQNVFYAKNYDDAIIRAEQLTRLDGQA